MQIHCFAAIPLDQDAPVPAIRQFVRILRDCAVGTDHAEVDLNLIGISTRAKTTIQEFRPKRTEGAPFSQALEIAEDLTNLGAVKIKSLHFLLSAEGFHWKGSSEGSSAKLALLDGKVFQRKERFGLSAHLIFEASDPKEPLIEKMLGEIAKATGIRFQLQASIMRAEADEPGRATSEELFLITLAWTELIQQVREKVREKVSLAGVPHLMTTSEAHQFLFDPNKFGKSVRVDFTRILHKWLKEKFPDYTRIAGTHDGELLRKEIADGVVATLSVDKKPGAFSKRFTVWLGIGLTLPRFAATRDRPFALTASLFELFGYFLPMQWTYHTEADLREALQGAADLLRQVLVIFEPRAAQMGRTHVRSIEEFAGPREVSAKEAYELALPLARTWAQDAGLIRITSNMVAASYLSSMFPVPLPVLNGAGRLAMSGGWWLQFHSRSKEENLHVRVPCRGQITQMRSEAPQGRHWPSDADQIMRDGWMDSDEALGAAQAAAGCKLRPSGTEEIQTFELSSRANLAATGVIRPPFRDGMFVMDPAWRIWFS